MYVVVLDVRNEYHFYVFQCIDFAINFAVENYKHFIKLTDAQFNNLTLNAVNMAIPSTK